MKTTLIGTIDKGIDGSTMAIFKEGRLTLHPSTCYRE